jgi:hypothetical protein
MKIVSYSWPLLWFPQYQLSFHYIIGCQFQYFANAHTPASHQLKHKTISGIGRPKNDFIYGIFIQDIPLGFYLWSIKLAQQWGITGVYEIRIEVVYYEIEKCG